MFKAVVTLLLWLAPAAALIAPGAVIAGAPGAAAAGAALRGAALGAKKVPKKSTGGGFGAAVEKRPPGITNDKGGLERQWDRFVAITKLEIVPTGDDAFEVVDVFARNGNAAGAPWWRVGKVAAAPGTTAAAALTLQRGLILWTAVHMREELMAAGGRDAAAALEVGFDGASFYMATAEDGPHGSDARPSSVERIDGGGEDGADDGADEVGFLERFVDGATDSVRVAEKASVKGVPPDAVGFRPDWNPPGFRYKRLESAAMKKPASRLDAIR